MSQANATALLEKLDSDDALRAEWQASVQEAMQAAMIAFGERHHLHFTPAELGAALEEHQHLLREEDLARVAGGGGLNPQPDPPRSPLNFQRLLSFTMPRYW